MADRENVQGEGGMSVGTLAFIPPDCEVLDNDAVEMLESAVLTTALQMTDRPSPRDKADARRATHVHTLVSAMAIRRLAQEVRYRNGNKRPQ
jgi:hypothetical protein